ncbi:glutamate ABC transporter substrate-binding protein [Nocardioides sp. ChNu-153]|nr:glutamate ABC transporter substrate-binding protein [Nocardioides sp. ChNu-99]MDN7122349.1 glutamate ABC transporter substrate-binding protein [Nocardioides sp. ChNu-153]
MRLRRTMATMTGLVLAASLAACGDAGSDEEESVDVDVNSDAAESFEEGTRMRELADQGTIKIGVKFDQPGIGYKGATDEVPTGFDPQVGTILAASLGIAADDIEWVETISANRESFLESGEVDLVIASYSITDARREVVGQAGPYYVTGQQLLVPADSDIAGVEDVQGQEVCSVTGSTSLDNAQAEGAVPRGFDTYSECVDQVRDGTVAAMTTDGAILLGYAAEDPDNLKVVGDPFSEERYGIGYSIDAPEMCGWINETLEESFDDGTWEEAFNNTLGVSLDEAPEPPALDPCA